MRTTIDKFYDQETLRKLQLLQLELLKKFISICEKYKIQYFAVYGTLLGTVRHKGIIPWDDDIDVAMLRRDYEKFLEVAPKELGNDFSIINADISLEYPFMTTRFMKKNTDFRTKSLKNIKCELGIFLDIFCYDNLPSNVKKQNIMFAKCYIYEKLYVLRHIRVPNLPYYGLKRAIVILLCNLGYIGVKLIPKKFLYTQCKKNSTKYMNEASDEYCYTFSLEPKKLVISKQELFPLKKLPFEDIDICVPNRYHEILTRRYGNYMLPPPEGKRSYIIPYSLDFGEDINE